MKKVVAFLTLLLTTSIAFAGTLSSEKIILTTQDWAPYQTYESYIIDGFAVATVSCVMEMMDKPFEVQVYPWKEAQQLVKDGKAHGFFSASKNSKRDAYATQSNPIADQQWNWYLLKETKLDPTSANFRKQAKVAGIAGSNMVTFLQDNGYQLANHEFIKMESLLKALMDKQVDAIFANNLAMRTVVKNTQQSMKQFQMYTTKDKPVGVYWSNTFLANSPGFLDKFNSLVGMCR